MLQTVRNHRITARTLTTNNTDPANGLVDGAIAEQYHGRHLCGRHFEDACTCTFTRACYLLPFPPLQHNARGNERILPAVERSLLDRQLKPLIFPIAPGDGKACHGKPIGFNAIFSTFQMVAVTIKTTKRYHDAMPTALIDASRKRAYRN